MAGEHEIVLSDLTMAELEQHPLRSELLKQLEPVSYTFMSETPEVRRLAENYLENGVLSRKLEADCRHFAFAVVSGCNILASWKFGSIVNYWKYSKVRIVNEMNGYFKLLDVAFPTMMLTGDFDVR